MYKFLGHLHLKNFASVLEYLPHFHMFLNCVFFCCFRRHVFIFQLCFVFKASQTQEPWQQTGRLGSDRWNLSRRSESAASVFDVQYVHVFTSIFFGFTLERLYSEDSSFARNGHQCRWALNPSDTTLTDEPEPWVMKCEAMRSYSDRSLVGPEVVTRIWVWWDSMSKERVLNAFWTWNDSCVHCRSKEKPRKWRTALPFLGILHCSESPDPCRRYDFSYLGGFDHEFTP